MITKARNAWFDFKKNFLDIYNFFGGNTQSFAYYNKFMNELSQANSLAELENNANLDNFSKLFVESLEDLEPSYSFENVLQEELKDLKEEQSEIAEIALEKLKNDMMGIPQSVSKNEKEYREELYYFKEILKNYEPSDDLDELTPDELDIYYQNVDYNNKTIGVPSSCKYFLEQELEKLAKDKDYSLNMETLEVITNSRYLHNIYSDISYANYEWSKHLLAFNEKIASGILENNIQTIKDFKESFLEYVSNMTEDEQKFFISQIDECLSNGKFKGNENFVNQFKEYAEQAQLEKDYHEKEVFQGMTQADLDAESKMYENYEQSQIERYEEIGIAQAQELSNKTENTTTHTKNVSQIEEESPKAKEVTADSLWHADGHVKSIKSLLNFFDKQAENNKNQSLNKKDFIKSFLAHCEKGMNTKEMQVLFLLYHKDPSKLFKEHKDMIEQGLLKALDNPKLLQADPLRSVIKLHLEHNNKLPSYIEKVTYEEKLNLIEQFSNNALDKQILGKNKDAFLNDTSLEKQVTQEIKGNENNAIGGFGGFNASKEELEWANSILSDKQKPLQTYSLNQEPTKTTQIKSLNSYAQTNRQPAYQTNNHNIGGRDM
ncbi:hypothetical protein [Helicobacter cetorum]|uniref:Uncharacterized protein n=1 Tax=Helicobacter cetorum (strain ATCC BAA-429 / MIT 00-7128) TaxID=182217 RepID=I0EMG4_HELC0|nr:hypothetical protein [Helicobacter cetorum]AFI04133.1 hypothetical protein HCW_04320 [Helicobacter cetorum MIT 00-7128]